MTVQCHICRLPIDGSDVVVRCGCNETFHGPCIGLGEGADDYVCDSCDSVAEEVERIRASMRS
jgi:hypothetical protein